MYHSVGDEFDKSSINYRAFSNQMHLMKKLGYESINLSDLNIKKNKKNFVITFDDGYFDIFKYAIPILNKLNFTATIFIVSDPKENINTCDQKKENYKKKLLMNDKQILELITN